MSFDYKNPVFWMIVIGGLGLFLYGITLISKVLKRIAGTKLKTIIDKCSSNRFLGLLTGAGFTAAIQSSGATSSLAIGLVRAGVMTLIQALAVIIGANIGTTITAFIISIPIMDYMAVFILLGAFIVLLSTRNKYQNIGDLIFSIGLIFFGLFLMEKCLSSLKDVPEMTNFFTFLTKYPWLGLLLGAIITAALQSSSAVIGIVQGIYGAAILGGSTAISLFGILPIVFGSNIGSTLTAILSSIGGSKDSKRVALFHLLFNVIGALFCMGFLYIFKAPLMQSYSWKLDPKLQLAFSHLIFNVFAAIIFLPLINPCAKLLCKIIPGDDKRNSLTAVKELDKGIMHKFPNEGILMAKEVTETMFSYTVNMFQSIKTFLKDKKREDALFVHDIEENVDRIDRNLNEYLLEADKGEMSERYLKIFSKVLRGSKDIERIGDYAENIITFYEKAYDAKDDLSSKEYLQFDHYNDEAIKIINDTIIAFKNDNIVISQEISQRRRDLNEEIDDLINQHFTNMNNKEKADLKYIDLVYVDLANAYQRVFSHCADIAKLVKRDKKYELTQEEIDKFNDMANRY